MTSSKKGDQGRRLIAILVQTVEIGLILGLSVIVFLLWQRLQASTQQLASVQATLDTLEAERLNALNQPTSTPLVPQADSTSAASDANLLAFSDPNDPALLNPMFGWQPGNADVNSYDLTLEPGTLTLLAGGGTEQWQLTNSSPFIVLPVSGNFDVTVKMESSPTELYQRAGIGLRSAQDVNTWVNISRNYHGAISGNEGIMVLSNQQGNSSLLSNTPYTAEVCFLKIERRGFEVSLSYSEDGTNWMVLEGNYAANFGDPVEIYLMSSSTSARGLTAQFSELTLTVMP